MAIVDVEIRSSGRELWPSELRAGERALIAFHADRVVGAMSVPRYRAMVLDARGRRVAILLQGAVRADNGVVFVEWDGRDDRGALVEPGTYRLRIEGLGRSRLMIEGTLPVSL